jgi:hypothetical protein
MTVEHIPLVLLWVCTRAHNRCSRALYSGAPLSISAEHGEGVSALFPPILSAAEAKARELDALVREAAVEAPGGIAPSAGEKAHAATLPVSVRMLA